jgi:hypothetical protein
MMQQDRFTGLAVIKSNPTFYFKYVPERMIVYSLIWMRSNPTVAGPFITIPSFVNLEP